MAKPITDERLAEIEAVLAEFDRDDCEWTIADFNDRYCGPEAVSALLARLTAEREAREKAESRVEELEAQGEAVSAEFEGDCWKVLRKLLTKFNYNWQDADADGVSADDAHEFLTEAMEYDESRAEAAEAKLTAAEERFERSSAGMVSAVKRAIAAEAEAARLREALLAAEAAFNGLEALHASEGSLEDDAKARTFSDLRLMCARAARHSPAREG